MYSQINIFEIIEENKTTKLPEHITLNYIQEIIDNDSIQEHSNEYNTENYINFYEDLHNISLSLKSIIEDRFNKDIIDNVKSDLKVFLLGDKDILDLEQEIEDKIIIFIKKFQKYFDILDILVSGECGFDTNIFDVNELYDLMGDLKGLYLDKCYYYLNKLSQFIDYIN